MSRVRRTKEPEKRESVKVGQMNGVSGVEIMAAFRDNEQHSSHSKQKNKHPVSRVDL